MSNTLTDIKDSALDLIGNTPLVALDRIWPDPGRLLAKCEFLNPGGSIKDRGSYAMIKNARESGHLQPGDPVVEMTSGNLGCGLALACAVLGHPLTVTMSRGNSPQRATMIRGLGAQVVLVDQVDGTPGNVTQADINAAVEKAREIEKTTGAFYVDQFNNTSNLASHETNTGDRPEVE